MLDADIKQQLEQYLQLIEDDIVIKLSTGSDKLSEDMTELVNELATMSSKVKVEKTELERTPSFSINRPNEDTGITFAGLPLGQEFTSLVLALLQVSGRAPKVDESLTERVKQLDGEYHFETYVSLSCHNCPVVVQALNVMAVLNPNVTHSMVEGGAFQDEVESKNIMGVPTIFLNGEEWGSGRMELEDILNKLGSKADPSEFENKEPFDVLIIGGGPAGGSAAIYAARKGVRTGIVTDRLGGQVLDTQTIENFISVKETDGPALADSIFAHVEEYGVDVMRQMVKNIEKKDDSIEVELENGAVLKSKTAIITTGARWRNIGVPGEEEYQTKGVAYCTHCDAPLFEDKDVSVIGGGNSGIEAAIDLAGVAKNVTVLEFMDELKADSVLQERLGSLPNVNVVKNAATKEIIGDGTTVTGISYTDRVSEEERKIDLDGVFVQIGLVPNTDWVDDSIEKSKTGEIIVDKNGATNVPGIYAAGDCTDSTYKQIITSMGTGATAALAAFDYIIRN